MADAGWRPQIEPWRSRWNGKPAAFIRSITLPDEREVELSTGSSND
jgi:hypothetical protein